MERREFLYAAAAGAFAASRGWTQNRDQNKLARISIMALNFNAILKDNQPASPARTIEIMEIGEILADRFGVHNVELQHIHLPSTETSWLKDFRARLAKSKTQITQINVEAGNTMWVTADTAVGRLQGIDLTKRWIDHAAVLGCARVLVNQGQPTQENKQAAIAYLKTLVAYATPKKIKISMESRGAGGARGSAGGPGMPGAPGAPPAQVVPAAPPAAPGPPSYLLLVELIKGSGAYANLDIGNFANEAERLDGIRAMIPLTSGNTHVKPASNYDLPKMLALTKELGFNGLYAIEAGGGGGGRGGAAPATPPSDPYENTRKLLDVVLANI